MKITATIISLNEEKNIAKCLESLREVVDEIVVVDSLSKDKTQEICERYGVRFISQKFLGYAEQKNFAASFANNDYIFSIDADEYLSEKLRLSLLKLKSSNSVMQAYYVKRLNNFWGHWIKTCGLYPDKQLRLYNKEYGEFKGKYVHESVCMQENCKTGLLEGNLMHNTFADKESFAAQQKKYAELKAKEYAEKNKRLPLPMIYIKVAWRFFKNFVLQRGFLNGKTGLFICKQYALYEYNKYKRK